MVHAFATITRLGDPATLTTIGVAVFLALLWRRSTRLALTWAASVGGSALLNAALKLVFARARPPHEDGLISQDDLPAPDRATLAAAVEKIRAAFPADAVDLYLQTLVALDADTWRNLDALLTATP